jgi:hypothetical protein
MALPMKHLYNLQLAVYKKVSVAIIFILGNLYALSRPAIDQRMQS